MKAETADFAEDEDARPGSVQPVVMMSKDGERDFANMRWGFKLPDRLLFNTRSDAALTSKFWKEKFAEYRCIIPASSFFEWHGDKGSKTKYEVVVPHHKYLGWPVCGLRGRTLRPRNGRIHFRSPPAIRTG